MSDRDRGSGGGGGGYSNRPRGRPNRSHSRSRSPPHGAGGSSHHSERSFDSRRSDYRSDRSDNRSGYDRRDDYNRYDSSRRDDNRGHGGDNRPSYPNRANSFGGRDRGRGSYHGGPSRGGGGGGHFENIHHEPGPIDLMANFIELSCSTRNWILNQYHVDMFTITTINNEEIKTELFNPKLRRGLLSQHKTLFDEKFAYDGRATLYSIVRLPDLETKLDGVLRSRSDNEEPKRVEIIIKFTNELDKYSFESKRMFNVMFKNCLKLIGLNEYGRQRAYFDFKNVTELQQYKMKIAPGYNATMDIYVDRYLLCVEVAHKILSNETVLERMNDIAKKERPENFREQCEKYFLGDCIVMTTYNNKNYRIDSIEWSLTPMDTFEKRNNTRITYKDYISQRYGKAIRDTKQPLLRATVRTRDREPMTAILIPELCLIAGNKMKEGLNFNELKDIDTVVKMKPDSRHARISKFLDQLQHKDEVQNELHKWDMKFERNLVSLRGEVLKKTEIIFGNNQKDLQYNKDWNNSLKSAHHVRHEALENWILVYSNRDDREARNLNQTLVMTARSMGLNIRDAQFCEIGNPSASEFVNRIRDKVYQNNRIQMIVCILPRQDGQVYSAIKKLCCCDLAIPSQIVTKRNIEINANKTRSVITKVAIQMSCKLGGAVWAIEVPFKNMMVIGVDVCTNRGNNARSVVSFVSSLDGNQSGNLNSTQYYSKCAQENGYIFSQYETYMEEALMKYREKNNKLPQRILLYRNGINDAEINTGIQNEIEQIERSFRKFENYDPTFTFMIVKKSTNARFFHSRQNGQIGNAPIGTIIDKNVVKEAGKEFYLISQQSDQGTVNPTHYRIVKDSTIDREENEKMRNTTLERLQIITYKFCHLYYNWPGPIKVPAQVHYATKLARLVSESMGGRPHHPNLNEKLFYL